jgi:transposase
MWSVTVFVGLDYHDCGVQVCVLDSQNRVLLNRRCPNDWRALAETVAPYGARVQAAIEACCGAANLAEELIARAGWQVDLAHPGYVARMKQSPDKTDYSDARMLADLERVGYLPRVWLAPEAIRELRRLVRYRQQLVRERRSCKLRIRGLLRDCRATTLSHAWTKLWLAWLSDVTLPDQARWILDQHLLALKSLEERIEMVEQRLQKVTVDDPVVQRLLQEKGVGLITAATLRAEIGRFDRFRTGKQLSRFCSLTPRNASSGQRQADAGLIKAGNSELRRVLIEAAHRLARHVDRWGQLASELRQRGKPGSVVAAAVANRWVCWLYHQMLAVA